MRFVSFKNTEEENYYYEYPFYDDGDDKNFPSQTGTDTTSEKVEVIKRKCTRIERRLFPCGGAGINRVLSASQDTRVNISGKVTSTSTSSSSGGTGSSSSSSSSTTAGEETGPYDGYDGYGNYETYYDETTSLPDGDGSRRVTISTNAGAKVDLGLGGKIESGTGVGTSVTITRNKTRLVSEMAAFHLHSLLSPPPTPPHQKK